MDVFGKGFDMHQGRDSTRHPRRFPSAARNTHAARSTQHAGVTACCATSETPEGRLVRGS